MYYVGRKHGESVFRTAWGRRLMPPPVLAAVKDAYDRHGVAGIFVSRLLPGVRAAVTPFAGVVGMSPLRALVPTALASALWYALLVAAGSALGLNWESVRRLVERANTALGVVALLAAAAFAFWVWRRVRKA
jgi:membrane protein DedA with SNARE-associated domain